MALYDGRVKKKVWFLLRVVIIRFIIWILGKILNFKYLEKTKDERWLNLTPSCLGWGGGEGESWFYHGLETGVGCKFQYLGHFTLFMSGLSLELGQVTFLAGAYLCRFLSYGTTGSFPTSSGWDALVYPKLPHGINFCQLCLTAYWYPFILTDTLVYSGWREASR